MSCIRNRSRFHTRWNSVSARWLPAALAALACGTLAGGDVIYLKGGGTVEGDVLEQGDPLSIRTIYGVIKLPADGIERIEEAPSPLAEYGDRREKAADTADSQFELAHWCEEQGMRAEARKHYQRTIELDPQHEKARAALGYVRVGDMWVDAKTVVDRGPADSEKKAKAEPDSEKLVNAIQGQWSRRIRSIRTTMLDRSVDSIVQSGFEKIREIKDPLAILPLTRILSDGNVNCRLALVEALTRFAEDEATLNLAALALLDADEGVRAKALTELVRRDDPRVIAQFRKALYSDSDPLIRRAAIALRALGAESAVPELIESLKVQRRKLVEVPVRTYFSAFSKPFDRNTGLTLGSRGSVQVSHPATLGVAAAGAFVTVTNEKRMQTDTVFRTEVLEALVQLTGVNHGFDDAAWRRWYQEHKP